MTSQVKNRLKITGSIQDLIMFINDNYEKDIYHPSDGVYPSNLILFFGKLLPTPKDIENDKDKVYKWRMNNWGTPFLINIDDFSNELVILYKHDYGYTPYTISNDDNKFNPYTINKVLEYSEMFYGENIHQDENELISIFTTTMTPPSKLITTWVNKYRYSTLVFRLDYMDVDERFVGNVHYDYNDKMYILEHYVKSNDELAFITYMLYEDIKTIEDYTFDISKLIVSLNNDNKFEEIYKMVLNEIENKNDLQSQAEFIYTILTNISKKCNL